MIRLLIFLILNILIFSCQSNTTSQNQEETNPPPNVILFLGDDMELDYLGSFEGQYNTPNFDRLADEGMRFQKAYCSTAACTPSRFSVLTGQYAGRNIHPQFLQENPTDQMYMIGWNTPIAPENVTLADLFKEAGYYTGFSGKWHVGGNKSALNAPTLDPDADPADPEVDRKLREHHRVLQEAVKSAAGFDYAGSVLWANYEQAPIKALRHHHFEWITQGAVDFLDQVPEDQPFFLYFASTALHGPSYLEALKQDPKYTLSGVREEPFYYHPSRDSLKTRIEAMGNEFNGISSGLLQMDDQMGALMQKLEEIGRAENTIIVFLADHNREPGKATCYEKGVQVPMIMKWPGTISPGSVTAQPVQNIDIYPTLVAGCNLPTSQELALDGKSFLPLLKQEEFQPRDNFYYEFGYTRSVSDGRYKYIALRYPDHLLQQMESGQLEEAPNQINNRLNGHHNIAMQYFPGYFDQDQLYDLQQDPYEQKNLAYQPEYSDKLTDMKVKLDQVLHSLRHPYDLDRQPFLETEQFDQMAQKTRNIGTDHIFWWNGKDWPPKK